MFSYALIMRSPLHTTGRLPNTPAMSTATIGSMRHSRCLYPAGERDRHFRDLLLLAMAETGQELSVGSVEFVEGEPFQNHAVALGPIVQF